MSSLASSLGAGDPATLVRGNVEPITSQVQGLPTTPPGPDSTGPRGLGRTGRGVVTTSLHTPDHPGALGTVFEAPELRILSGLLGEGVGMLRLRATWF